MNPPEDYGPREPEPQDVRLARVEERLASIQEHGATKADLRELETRMIKWIVGTGVALAAVIVAVGLLS